MECFSRDGGHGDGEPTILSKYYRLRVFAGGRGDRWLL